MYDILLKDGLVVDPGNRILGRLHVGIQGGRIACVTDREVEAKQVIMPTKTRLMRAASCSPLLPAGC
ncbi:MAG: hypothetical protein ABT01_01385 [Clostridium sp. SCN 57-10]|nr:MAG: hypothetical protein ABT01_01385 [Clostridium sp. SCN 57-10]